MALALWPKSTKDHFLSKTRAGKPFTCQICKKRFTSKKNKRAHASKHIARLPHHCEAGNITFQSRSHPLKHATSHNRETHVFSAKINKFLKSFGPSSCEIRNSYKSTNNDISLHSPTANNENEDTSIQLSVNNMPKTDDLKPAAAETASAFGGDPTDKFIKLEGIDNQESKKYTSVATSKSPNPAITIIRSNTAAAAIMILSQAQKQPPYHD